MRLGSLALLLLSLTCLPYALAQVPTPPADPVEAVALACATVEGVEPQARELLPICDVAEPQPPAAPDEEAPAQGPAAPQTAPALVDEILAEAQAIPEDPESAPDRIQAILATILQFIKDAIGAPGTAIAKLQADVGELRASVNAVAKDATQGARDAAANVRGAIAGALDAVRDLFARAPADAPPAAKLPETRLPREIPVQGLVDGVARLV